MHKFYNNKMENGKCQLVEQMMVEMNSEIIEKLALRLRLFYYLRIYLFLQAYRL